MLRNNKNVSNLLSLSDVYNPVWLLEFGILHVNKSNDLMYFVSKRQNKYEGAVIYFNLKMI